MSGSSLYTDTFPKTTIHIDTSNSGTISQLTTPTSKFYCRFPVRVDPGKGGRFPTLLVARVHNRRTKRGGFYEEPTTTPKRY